MKEISPRAVHNALPILECKLPDASPSKEGDEGQWVRVLVVKHFY